MDNLQYSWYNLNDHEQQQQQQTFDFDSENMFLNPTHQLSPANWADQAIAAADLICNNPFLDTTKPTTKVGDTSPECLLSGNNSSTGHTSDKIPVIFSDCKDLHSDNIVVNGNNNVSVVSSGDSMTEDSGNVSQCSSGKRPISGLGGSYNEPLYKPKRSRSDTGRPASSNINFQQAGSSSETDTEAIAQMKEMIYREAAFRPVSFAETLAQKPKRKNVRISSDPQTVAARQRRERISERIRVLQKLVPGGNKMDTASMLDEAANYLKFLRSTVKALEHLGQNSTTINAGGTSSMIPHASLVVPFAQNRVFMQPHFLFPHENFYPSTPPA